MRTRLDTISAIATFIAVIIALFPLLTASFNKIIRKNALILQIYYIFEDIIFFIETEDVISRSNITKWYSELNELINANTSVLPYKITNALFHFIFLIRIYDDSNDAKIDIEKSANEVHRAVSKLKKD